MEDKHIVCTQCDGVNRVPAAKNAGQAKGGKCHTPLFDGQPAKLQTSRFERHLSKNTIPLLVDFWASWCGPCRAMAPSFTQAAQTLAPEIRLAKVNTEEAPELAQRYGIRSIPTLVLFREGQEVARTSGAMNHQQLVNWVRQNS